MKKNMLPFLLFLLLAAVPAQAFMEEGCGAGNCADCHSLSVQEAATLFKGNVDKVLKVELAEVPGLWLVEVEKDKKRYPLYIDFSKGYVVAGNIIRLKDGQNITGSRSTEDKRVDPAQIPLGDALLLGKSTAKTKVIVFTDPECPYCKKLHAELQEVVRRDPEIAFLIKLFPLKMHPNAYTISKSIVCNRSLAMLEESFAGKTVPPPLCETRAIDDTLALVEKLGINSTPTLVLPDGRVMPGYKKADDLLKLLGAKTALAPRAR
ncbi:MAG TPA: DsbC family protein [Desulfuromonadales bacterium]|nr:DsbC family protein [Desulfuromonadales bacterium]